MQTIEKAATVAGILMVAGTAALLIYGTPPVKRPPPPPDTAWMKNKVVPYVPTSQVVVDSMLILADVKKGDVLYDLGSGDGRIVITAAKRYGIRAVGYEIDPELVAYSRDWIHKEGLDSLAEIRDEDLFTADLRPATVLAIYLFEHLNLRLRPAIQSQMRPGSRVVSHNYRMGDWKPDTSIVVEGDINVYLWRIPERR